MAKSLKPSFRDPVGEPLWLRLLLCGLAITFMALILILPLVVIFYEAFRFGIMAFIHAITTPDTLSSIRLTLIVALIAVPINVVFGIIAAWAIAKFDFRGKSFLITLIDLPFSISPVVVGLSLVLIFGASGWAHAWLDNDKIQIMNAVPGVILATIFVTFPFVARELIPLMQEQGTSDEEAALSLGAGGFKTFIRVTLPNIKWALLYGVLLCNARAMGEFGAVAVVSGRLRGETMTMPLQIEMLYQENYAAAFAVASLLTLLALVTLVLKTIIEKVYGRDAARAGH